MADWRIRPLPEEMLLYARSDTHFLLNIYDHLRNDLLEKSKDEINPSRAMGEVLALSANTALNLYSSEEYNSQSGLGRMGWKNQQRKWLSSRERETEPGIVFQRLHAWRDRVAREEDESPLYVVLISIGPI